MKAIKNVNIVLTNRIIPEGTIIFDEKIQDILSVNDLSKYKDIEIIDGLGGYITPGFIDIHIHGFYGYDTMEGNYEALNAISKNLLKTGVTSFLPTTMTMEYETIQKALASIADIKEKEPVGAQILGANVEGPFINPKYKGAQSEENIQQPNAKLLKEYLNIIKIVTIAPEITGSIDFIKEMKDKGVITSVGHSAATYEDVEKARKFGLTHATHLFNAMTGLNHRNPGIVGAILSNEMTCEIIADYIHINPVVLKIITQTKDIKDIILITDSMEAGGLSEGEYSLGGQKVIVKGGEVRLENGSLAGSVLTMDKAIKNMINATGLPINEVVNMATYNPARLLNMDNKLGQLKKELQADIVLVDKNFAIKKVFVKGEEKLNS